MSGDFSQPLPTKYTASTDLTTIPRPLCKHNTAKISRLCTRPQTLTGRFTRGSFPVPPERTISSKDWASHSAHALPSHLRFNTIIMSDGITLEPPYNAWLKAGRPESESTDLNSVASYTANYCNSESEDSYPRDFPSTIDFLPTQTPFTAGYRMH